MKMYCRIAAVAGGKEVHEEVLSAALSKGTRISRLVPGCGGVRAGLQVKGIGFTVL